MRRTVSFLGLLAAAGLLLAAAPGRADPPPAAEAVLADAVRQARAAHKPIFLHFGASW